MGYKAGPDAPTVYSLEGSIAVGGSSIKWCVPAARGISKSSFSCE